MTIQSSNNTLSLRYRDAFEYTWNTSKQQNDPAFFTALRRFFVGKSVQKKDLENYLVSLNDLQKSHIFTTIQGIPRLNTVTTTRTFAPNNIMLKNLENALQSNKTSTLPTPLHQSEKFKNYGYTCFINSALKCVLNSFKRETLNTVLERHKKLLAYLTNQLISTDLSSHHIRDQINNKIQELVEKNKLIKALQTLIDVYFNINNKKSMNTALRYFINEMFQFGKKNKDHFFNKLFIPDHFSPNGYRVKLNSTAELIPHLSQLITGESSEIYGLTSKNTELEKIRDQGGKLICERLQVKEKKRHHGELVLHIHPDYSLQQDVDEMQNPKKEFVDLLQAQSRIESDAVQLSPENDTASTKTTRNHYSGDLSRLECLFVNPVLMTTSSTQTITRRQAAKKLMAKLDNNIVLTIKHSGKSNRQHRTGQLYRVTLQPQAISLHHHCLINVDHKTALIRNTNHQFVHHSDKKVKDLNSPLATLPDTPEGIMYTVVSIDRDPTTAKIKNTP